MNRKEIHTPKIFLWDANLKKTTPLTIFEAIFCGPDGVTLLAVSRLSATTCTSEGKLRLESVPFLSHISACTRSLLLKAVWVWEPNLVTGSHQQVIFLDVFVVQLELLKIQKCFFWMKVKTQKFVSFLVNTEISKTWKLKSVKLYLPASWQAQLVIKMAPLMKILKGHSTCWQHGCFLRECYPWAGFCSYVASTCEGPAASGTSASHPPMPKIIGNHDVQNKHFNVCRDVNSQSKHPSSGSWISW